MRSLSVMLIVVCLVSAFSVVWIRYENRLLSPQLHARYALRDDLNIEWRKLLAERSTLARHDQMKNWANKVGKMSMPSEDVVVYLKKRYTEWVLLEHK